MWVYLMAFVADSDGQHQGTAVQHTLPAVAWCPHLKRRGSMIRERLSASPSGGERRHDWFSSGQRRHG